MSFGTVTVIKRAEGDGPLRADVLSFLGDDGYPAGGTAAFEAFIRTAVGRGALEIVGVLAGETGGHMPVYDFANDKLKVYESAATGNPLVEVSGDQSAFNYELTILSV